MDEYSHGTTPMTKPWKTLIAPHAGWAYSGAAMGAGFRWLAAANPNVDLVVVFASHRGPDGPNTIYSGAGWETPLGNLLIAQPLAHELKQRLAIVSEPKRPGRPDNAAEVLMPFVKHFFPKAELLMLGVAASDISLSMGEQVAQAIVDANRNAVFVGSTDLTHYGPNYGFSPEGTGEAAAQWVKNVNDRGFIDALLSGNPLESLRHAQSHLSACCPGAALAAWQGAQTLHLNDPNSPADGCEVVHYLSHYKWCWDHRVRDGCEVVPGDSFVGYASLVF